MALRARSLIAPGVQSGFEGARRLTLTSMEDQIRAMPGLLHYLDPADLTVRNVMKRDRASGAPILWSKTSVVKVASAAGFNNKPVLQFTTNDTDLTMGPGFCTPSYTIIMAAAPEATAGFGAAQAALMSTSTPTLGTEMYWRWQNLTGTINDGLYFTSDQGDGGDNTAAVLTGNSIGGNAQIYALSFDADTLTARMYSNLSQAGPATTKVLHVASACPPEMKWNIGHVPGTTVGMIGQQGIILIFDRAMDVPGSGLEAYFSLACNLLKTFYAIS